MKPFYEEDGITILEGDCVKILPTLPDQCVNCCVTSPPYWGLRDYGTAIWEGGEASCSHQNAHSLQGQTGQRADRTFTGSQNFYQGVCAKCGARRIDSQIGLEPTPEEYVSRMVEVFREVRRVLRDDGTLWLNLGDSYASDAGVDRMPTTLPGSRLPSGWTNRAQPHRVHTVSRSGSSCDPKRGDRAEGQPYNGSPCGNGLKPKDLCMMPARVAIALQADGWYLRSDIIWHKPNPMPESVTDRPTKAHEYLFLLSKSERYYYDAEAIAEKADPSNYRGNPSLRNVPPGQNRQGKLDSRRGEVFCESRNKRSVWTVPTEAYPEAHFATFPTALIDPCIKAGCPAGGTVLDPFGGSGTTMQVARALGCRGLMIELNAAYCILADKRLRQAFLPLAETPDNISQECRRETKDLFEENSVA